MARTDSFRAQHKEILEVVKGLQALLTPAALETKAEDARTLLSSLAGKLVIHLAMEDKSLYPAMTGSSNENAKKIANDFMTEMGSIADVFKKYTSEWPSARRIKENPAGFCEQTKAIIEALGKRVEREESILYPLADSI